MNDRGGKWLAIEGKATNSTGLARLPLLPRLHVLCPCELSSEQIDSRFPACLIKAPRERALSFKTVENLI